MKCETKCRAKDGTKALILKSERRVAIQMRQTAK